MVYAVDVALPADSVTVPSIVWLSMAGRPAAAEKGPLPSNDQCAPDDELLAALPLDVAQVPPS